MAADAAGADRLSPAALPLFRELGDLKRIHSATAPGSIAERLFVSGWAALVRGDAPAQVAERGQQVATFGAHQLHAHGERTAHLRDAASNNRLGAFAHCQFARE